jgi:hypothetical protein
MPGGKKVPSAPQAKEPEFNSAVQRTNLMQPNFELLIFREKTS